MTERKTMLDFVHDTPERVAQIKEMLSKDHKTLTMQERAECLSALENEHINGYIKYWKAACEHDKGKKQEQDTVKQYVELCSRKICTPEFLLSSELNPDHRLWAQLHFDELFCKDCNRKFHSMFNISEDYGAAICGLKVDRERNILENGVSVKKIIPETCWGYPIKLPQ
jgi:hypothetical protein